MESSSFVFLLHLLQNGVVFFLWWLVWITMIYMKFYKKKGVMKGVKRICQLVLYKITRDDIDYIFFLAVIMTI